MIEVVVAAEAQEVSLTVAQGRIPFELPGRVVVSVTLSPPPKVPPVPTKSIATPTLRVTPVKTRVAVPETPLLTVTTPGLDKVTAPTVSATVVLAWPVSVIEPSTTVAVFGMRSTTEPVESSRTRTPLPPVTRAVDAIEPLPLSVSVPPRMVVPPV